MFKPKKGSVLVFSLIILSIILSAAITVATVSVTNQRSASSTGKSVQSFQVADSGIELALQKIYKGNYATLNALATGMGGATSCTGGSISKSNVVGGDIKVSFYDNDGNLVTCTDTDWRDKVVRIKSEGSAFGTTRVVETAVAAATSAPKVYSCTGGSSCSVTVPASTNKLLVMASMYNGCCGSKGTGTMRVSDSLGSNLITNAHSFNGGWGTSASETRVVSSSFTGQTITLSVSFPGPPSVSLTIMEVSP